MTMTADTLSTIIQSTKGRIVTVSFIKDGGESRTITGRIGVKHKGSPASHRQDSAKRAFLLIYSMRDRGFRRINAEAVTSIKVDGLYIFNSNVLEGDHAVAC